jgi:hypothetical protein
LELVAGRAQQSLRDEGAQLDCDWGSRMIYQLLGNHIFG